MLADMAFTMLGGAFLTGAIISLLASLAMGGSQALQMWMSGKQTDVQKEMMEEQIAAKKQSQKKQREFLKKQQEKEKADRESQVKKIRQEQAGQVEAREAQQFQNFLSQLISGAYGQLLGGGQPGGQPGSPAVNPLEGGVPMNPGGMGVPVDPGEALRGGGDVSEMLAMLGPETQDELMQSAMQPAPSMAQGAYRMGIDDLMDGRPI